MQKLILKIEDSRYPLLLQFLKTLDYVQIVQPSGDSDVVLPDSGVLSTPSLPISQLALLQHQLERQSALLFQNIADPASWEQQQRNEWP